MAQLGLVDIGLPQFQSLTTSVQKPTEYIDDEADYDDYDTEIAPSVPMLNYDRPSVTVINKRTRETVAPLERSSYTELDLMPVRCTGCGKPIRQLAIEDSLSSGKSLRQTMDELNYKKICCREEIKSQPAVIKQLKQVEEYAKIARNLEMQNLFLESTGEAPRTLRSPGLVILDDVPPDFPEELERTIFMEGAAISEENPLENMDTFTYLQSQITDPEDLQ